MWDVIEDLMRKKIMFTLIVQYLYSTNLMKYFVLWTYKILIMTNLN